MISQQTKNDIILKMEAAHNKVLQEELKELEVNNDKQIINFLQKFERRYNCHLNIEKYHILPPTLLTKKDMISFAVWYLSHVQIAASTRDIVNYANDHKLIKRNLRFEPSRLGIRMAQSGLFRWYRRTGNTGGERAWYLKDYSGGV